MAFSGKNTKFSPSRVAQIVGSWDPRPCKDSGERERKRGENRERERGFDPRKISPTRAKNTIRDGGSTA